MEIYLVGGAVRDELLGRPVTERDWVVVGSTVDAMLTAGYRQVGRDFPVFLHPETAEEYALARTERKTAPGHRGFEVHADESVTLEEDLVRRDLTINAMARTLEGNLIDPHGGREDLAAKLLRHVSDAFREDPLRIFRVARFAAQLPGFSVAPETGVLMTGMAADGALDELSAERVFAELGKALTGPDPDVFLKVLADYAALSPWFEEFRQVPCVVPGAGGPAERFAVFCSKLAESEFQVLCERLKVPRAHQRLGSWLIRRGALIADWRSAATADVHRALTECRAFKPDGDVDVCLGLAEQRYDVCLKDLRQTVTEIKETVRADRLLAAGLNGAALGEALEQAQIEHLEQAQRTSES